MGKPLQRLEHIGIAVRSLDHSIPVFEQLLGYSCYKIEEVADQGVRTAFFDIGGIKIELLEAIGPSSPISGFLDRNGEAVHHLAFFVDEVDQALGELKGRGIKSLDRAGRPGADGLTIAFLNPKTTGGILVEVCSKE